MAAMQHCAFRLDGDRDAIATVRLSAAGDWMAMVKAADGRAVCCRHFVKFKPLCCAIAGNHSVFTEMPAILIGQCCIGKTVDQDQYFKYILNNSTLIAPSRRFWGLTQKGREAMKKTIIFIPIFALICFANAGLAAGDASSPDIFGIEVGNVFISQETDQGGSYTSTSEVISIDQTTFPKSTYIVESRGNGETFQGWVEKTTGELRLWGELEVATGEFLRFSSGLLEAWYPMRVGERRYSSATAELNIYPGILLNTSLTVDVLAKEPVVLDFDTLEAFKVRYQLRYWGYGIDETDTFYQWVTPYLGAVKYQDAESQEILTSFAIGGGTITGETDTDGDGLKDYQELIIYNTSRLSADTDGDRFSDGDEVNIHGTDPNDPDSHPSLAMPWLPLLLLDE